MPDTTVPEIEPKVAKELHGLGEATFVDVRDPDSFRAGHVPGAVHVHDGNIEAFVRDRDKTKPVVVYCYKGNSSKGGTAFLLERGFKEVQSLKGGMEGWQAAGGPVEAASAASASGAPAGFGVSPEARAQLTSYLEPEPEGTLVRITAEPNGAFGLSLDTAGADDFTFEEGGLRFAVAGKLRDAIAGLRIGFQEQPAPGFTLEGGEPPTPPGRLSKDEMRADVEQLIANHKIMLFMKGTAQSPMCGFSARTVQAVQSLGKPFGDKNAIEIPERRPVRSALSRWPTLPQLFIDGKLVGGCDIVMEMHQSGDLQKLADEAFSDG